MHWVEPPNRSRIWLLGTPTGRSTPWRTSAAFSHMHLQLARVHTNPTQRHMTVGRAASGGRTKVVGVAAGPQATAMMRRSSMSSLACRSSPAPTICEREDTSS